MLIDKLSRLIIDMNFINSNKKMSYLKLVPLLNTLDNVLSLPKIEQASTFITEYDLISSAKESYINLFNLFFSLGLSKEKIFFFDTNGLFSRTLDVTNWILSRPLNTSYKKLNKLSYKRFINKKMTKKLSSNIRCIVLLPNMSTYLKKMILKMRTPIVVHVDKALIHRGNKRMFNIQPKHIILVSTLYFFYKKGLNIYQKKKLYKVLMLLIR